MAKKGQYAGMCGFKGSIDICCDTTGTAGPTGGTTDNGTEKGPQSTGVGLANGIGLAASLEDDMEESDVGFHAVS